MERLTKAELVNGFPVCYPNNCSGLPEFATKGNPYRNIVERLKAYEDLEEQGKLLKLPCAVGDMTYHASTVYGRVVDAVVERIEIDSDGFWVITSLGIHSFDNFGKSVFLTREEAEAALKELERGKGE